MNKIIIRPFIPAMVNSVERWLMQMSVQGLFLVNMNGWKFTFEEKAIEEAEFFLYSSFGTSKGISADYCRAREKYGKRRSGINKSYCNVFEVDSAKKDSNFLIYKNERNLYYKKHYLRLLIFSLIAETVSIFISSEYTPCVPVAVVYFVITIYSLISVLILQKELNKDKKSSL